MATSFKYVQGDTGPQIKLTLTLQLTVKPSSSGGLTTLTKRRVLTRARLKSFAAPVYVKLSTTCSNLK